MRKGRRHRCTGLCLEGWEVVSSFLKAGYFVLLIGFGVVGYCATNVAEGTVLGSEIQRSTIGSPMVGLDKTGQKTLPDVIRFYGVTVRLADEDKWREFFNRSIRLVSEATNQFYIRGEPVSGKDLAVRMRAKLEFVKKVYSDPFGGEVATVLDVLTTADGLTREGVFGKRSGYEVVEGGKRYLVYDWLKRRQGVKLLPGEFSLEDLKRVMRGERGEEFLVLEVGTNRFRALVKLYDLLMKSEQLIELSEVKIFSDGREVKKEVVLDLLRQQITSADFRERYLLKDLSGLGAGGEGRATLQFKKVLMEAFELPESKRARSTLDMESYKRRAEAAEAIRLNEWQRAEQVWRDLLATGSHRGDRRFYTVFEEGHVTDIVDWLLRKLDVRVQDEQLGELPEPVERVLRMIDGGWKGERGADK